MDLDPESLPLKVSPLTPWKRALAWGILVFSVVGVALAATVIVVDGKWLPSLGMVAFGLTLIVDRAMYLRGVYAQRHELPVWNGIYIAANLLMTGSLFLNLALDKPRGGLGLLAAAGAIVLSMVVLVLAILMSGASWHGDTGPRRS